MVRAAIGILALVLIAIYLPWWALVVAIAVFLWFLTSGGAA